MWLSYGSLITKVDMGIYGRQRYRVFFRDTILVFIKLAELTSNVANKTNFISGIQDRHY
jgi:hypothetical protein